LEEETLRYQQCVLGKWYDRWYTKPIMATASSMDVYIICMYIVSAWATEAQEQYM
jgi:hypothetical protein